MNPTNRSQLFDAWAEKYDATIQAGNVAFPFDDYEQVLDQVVRRADVRPNLRILDLGIGTGNLAARFVHEGCEVWGIDFSAEMLSLTKAKLPQVHLLQADLTGNWSQNIQQSFDRVVSAYVLHEFDLTTKLAILRQAWELLSPNGTIVIADIAFPTVDARTPTQRWADTWDEDEYYWAADEAIAACERAGLHAAYVQVSSCGGVSTFTMRNAG